MNVGSRVSSYRLRAYCPFYEIEASLYIHRWYHLIRMES